MPMSCSALSLAAAKGIETPGTGHLGGVHRVVLLV